MPISRSLLELQLVDNDLARVRRERAHLDNGESLRADASTLGKAIAVEEENLNQLNRARASKEDELNQREQKLSTQQQRLMSAKSAHEVSSLQRDIESITKSRGELDEAILNFMEETDASAKKLDALRAQLQDVSTQLTAVEAAFAENSTRLDGELEAVLAQRTAAISPLNEEEKSEYEQSAKRHGGVAVAANNGGNCSACGMMLTPFNLKEARVEDWPTCESCGRLLFVE